ncbi:serine/threonine-protein kinase [Gandjariella thermophila]|uniref:non-specific serine/threonine protein kinase n=1 Tax=Gandjariella thermophila TaxID=1931992 RepID=A0A4D4JDT1_9PSEU|nr:serine/threonine-protein kinase [Gandjariella thermophila]GDY33180.1 hypothetical protein GTS_48130 [Gandjariella thermophila]
MTDEGELIAGRYRLVSQVGSGAMGLVWQAHDELLHRTVAVKQLVLRAGMSERETSEAKRRAMREGRITARLHHPHAITVYDVVEHEGQPCLVMEYLRSQSLADVLAARGTLPAERVAAIGDQVASALAAAHRAGIVHRDIKPGNVLLTDDGTAKITDFGISRAVGDGTVTASGILAGTPAYLAPEVAQGADAGFPADVFSLGATLYTAVEGGPPFGLDDNAMALLYRIASYEFRPPTRSGALTPVLTRLLARDPAQRPTMAEARDALAAVAGHGPAVTADPAGPAGDAVPFPAASPPAPPAEPAASPAGPAAAAGLPAPPAGPAAAAADPAVTAAGRSDTGGTTQAAQPTERIRGGRFRRGRAAAVAVVAVLVAAGVVAVVLATRGASRQGATAPTTSAATQAPPAPGSSGAAAPATTAVTTPAPTPATTPPPAPLSIADQLRNAITSYYAMMPGNLAEGWNWMTADYQANHAGGFSGYQRFWSAIDRVTLLAVSATPPSTVDATIDYFYRDGHVVEEQTHFVMVQEGDRWKIAGSTVSSSRTRTG